MSHGTYNRVVLVGRLGADPDLRYAEPEAGADRRHAWARFRIATDRPVARGTEPQTDWHTVTCRDRLAEFAGTYLARGRLVLVAGALVYRQWQDRAGAERTTAEILASEVVPLDHPPVRPGTEPVPAA